LQVTRHLVISHLHKVGTTFICLPEKKGRSGTRLRELTDTCNADHRLPIHFDTQTCKPLGENSTKFISFVALLSTSKASILCDDWDHVSENVKNHIWQSILV
ncbi:hypothetical protein V8G54_002597, partial [Vigna mungo]